MLFFHECELTVEYLLGPVWEIYQDQAGFFIGIGPISLPSPLFKRLVLVWAESHLCFSWTAG